MTVGHSEINSRVHSEYSEHKKMINEVISHLDHYSYTCIGMPVGFITNGQLKFLKPNLKKS